MKTVTFGRFRFINLPCVTTMLPHNEVSSTHTSLISDSIIPCDIQFVPQECDLIAIRRWAQHILPALVPPFPWQLSNLSRPPHATSSAVGCSADSSSSFSFVQTCCVLFDVLHLASHSHLVTPIPHPLSSLLPLLGVLFYCRWAAALGMAAQRGRVWVITFFTIANMKLGAQRCEGPLRQGRQQLTFHFI